MLGSDAGGSERLESGKEAVRERVLPQALPTLSTELMASLPQPSSSARTDTSWLSVAGGTMLLTLTVQRTLL